MTLVSSAPRTGANRVIYSQEVRDGSPRFARSGIAGGHAAAGLFNLLSEWGTVGVILAAELAAEQPSTERSFPMISRLAQFMCDRPIFSYATLAASESQALYLLPVQHDPGDRRDRR